MCVCVCVCVCVCSEISASVFSVFLTFIHVEEILASHLKHRQISRRELQCSILLNTGVSNYSRVDFLHEN